MAIDDGGPAFPHNIQPLMRITSPHSAHALPDPIETTPISSPGKIESIGQGLSIRD